jgi:hypothetical protein
VGREWLISSAPAPPGVSPVFPILLLFGKANEASHLDKCYGRYGPPIIVAGQGHPKL